MHTNYLKLDIFDKTMLQCFRLNQRHLEETIFKVSNMSTILQSYIMRDLRFEKFLEFQNTINYVLT